MLPLTLILTQKLFDQPFINQPAEIAADIGAVTKGAGRDLADDFNDKCNSYSTIPVNAYINLKKSCFPILDVYYIARSYRFIEVKGKVKLREILKHYECGVLLFSNTNYINPIL